MNFDDLGKPITTGRSGRVLLGLIYLAFAAFLGIGGVGGYSSNPPVMSVFIAIAIGLGYIGVRLVAIADGEYVFGRIASIVTGIIMMAAGVALAGLLMSRRDMRSFAALGAGIIFGVAGGAWLLRSAIRRKDEP
jgi:hypothetical protein